MTEPAVTNPDGPGPELVRYARVAVTALFFAFGVNVGIWAAHIPTIQARLEIDPFILGLALLASAIGTLSSQPIIGIFMARHGSRTATWIFAAGSAVITLLLVAAPAIPLLFVFTFLIGVFWGGFNVGMNTQASEIETLRGKPTMSSFHAAASLGMLSGAVLGGLIVGAGWGNGEGAAIVAVVSFGTALVSARFLIRDAPKERGPALTLPDRAVLGLGVLAFLSFLIEGGMIDWSALFLAIEKGATGGWAAAGYALFAAAMALFRIFGNRIVARFGRMPTVVVGAGAATIGIAIAVLSPSFVVAAFGLGLAGAGVANIVPILISTAGQTPGVPPSVGVSTVSTMLTAGLLVGPPIIGFVSRESSLSVGVSLMGLAGLAIAVMASLRRW